MTRPTSQQMRRFWRLARLERLTSDDLETFLIGLERPWTDSAEEAARRALRLRMAAAGEKYLDLLFPKWGRSVVRVLNVMAERQRCGDKIGTVMELVERTEQEVLKWKHFGPTSLRCLRRRLATAGLTLGMSPEEIETAFRPDHDATRNDMPLTAAAS